MKTTLSIVGILLVGASLFMVNSDWGSAQIRELIGKGGAAVGIQTTCRELTGSECKPTKLIARDVLSSPTLRPSNGQFQLRAPLTIGGTVLLSRGRKAIVDSATLQAVVSDLNTQLALPRDIPVTFTPCGEVNCFYDSRTQAITMCDEWLYKQEEIFGALLPEKFAQAMDAIATFAFAHEAYHALADQLQLHFTGPEEDVADQFAVYLLLGTRAGPAALATGAASFSAMGSFEQATDDILADEHSMSTKRAYNILCWTFGSDPERYMGFVANGFLPVDRARRCPKEFADLAAGFDDILQPHLR